MHACLIFKGWVVVATCLAVPVAAQPAGAANASPAWRSAFEGYQPYTEAPLASWRESNDQVGRIGGWRAYAREVQEAAAGASDAVAPPAAVRPLPAGAVPGQPAAPAAGHRH